MGRQTNTASRVNNITNEIFLLIMVPERYNCAHLTKAMMNILMALVWFSYQQYLQHKTICSLEMEPYCRV